MGVSPKHWGREGWRFIHWVALTYPNNPSDKDKQNYLKFFESLQDVLPCGICADHFRENMEKIPIRMDSNRELFNWTVDMHNIVNVQTNKKILTYNQAFGEVIRQNKKISDDLLKGIAFSSAIITVITLLSKQYVKRKK
jgi:Erv1 / Alr family